MKKMAQLLLQYKDTPDTSLEFSELAGSIEAYKRDLLERLTLGIGTDKLQGLSDTDVTVEVSTYLLWKSLNG